MNCVVWNKKSCILQWCLTGLISVVYVKVKAVYVTDESVDSWHVEKYSWKLSMAFVCLPYRKLYMGLEKDINEPKIYSTCIL